MKVGARALGIAESYRSETSTLCGAVVTGEGVVDGLGFHRITVGGVDATEAILALWDEVGRPDVRVVMVSGVALAWYNIVDLHRLADAIPVPVIALTYEESGGLRSAIEREFEDEVAVDRIERIEALPERTEYTLDEETMYVRRVDADEIDIQSILRATTRAGGRPEPVRVARMAARAADRYRAQTGPTEVH